MTLSTYRTSPYWKAAIELGATVARLADDLPATEEFGLSASLRKSAISLPAYIAADLMEGGSANLRFRPVLKLTAALDLIDHIYPALDTASARSALEALAQQLSADDFGGAAEANKPATAAAADTPVVEAPAAPAAPSAPAMPAMPAASAAPAAPALSVPVAPAEPAEPQLASPLGQTPAAVTVPVAQENHVQSNSQE